MKRRFVIGNTYFVVVISLALLLASCGTDEPASQTVAATAQQPGAAAGMPAPAQPAAPVQIDPQNPLGALAGALGGMMSGQAQGGTPVVMIPWQTLSHALPMAAVGWAPVGQVRGESANMMGIAVSTASLELVSGTMQGKVDIVDTTMNPLIAMPFNLARAARVDSGEERMGPVMLGSYPATQKLDKRNGSAEVVAMVGNRIMITVHVINAGSEQPALALAQMVNFNYLASSIPQ